VIHFFSAELQPATNWIDHCGDVEVRGGYPKDQPLWCECCGQQHLAKDCVVQCYYDGMSVWCAPDKGCKDPNAIAEKKAREFANRSAGQKARRAREKESIGV